MRGRITLIASIALLGASVLVSCSGRRADGTPNGETVEVVLESSLTATDDSVPPVTDMQQSQQ